MIPFTSGELRLLFAKMTDEKMSRVTNRNRAFHATSPFSWIY
jgi:hypothetical protein